MSAAGDPHEGTDVLYLAGDAYNIDWIKKRAARDPSFLDRKIP